MNPAIFTRKEVEKILGLSRITLWRMEKKGILKPSFRVNGRARYSLKDIERAATHKTASNG